MNLRLYMQNRYKKLLIAGFFISSLLCGCGKKRKNIFSFPSTPQKTISIRTLDFPCVKNIQVHEDESQCIVSWSAIQVDASTPLPIQESSRFIGYNIYGFNKNAFIPHKSLNKKPIQELSLTIKKKKRFSINCYIVVAVFQSENRIIEGPTSKIYCV